MRIAAPGRMVGDLHVQASGQGTPVVVLEAGLAASSVSWSLVQQRVARVTTVLSYDRAGLGWSRDAAARGATARDASVDLAAMLGLSGFEGPYVMVGHSFGALIARVFEQDFPRLVAGLVLVDPVVRAEWRDMPESKAQMLRRGVMLSRRGAWLARFGVVRAALWMLTNGSRRIPQMLAGVSAGNGVSVTNRLVGEVRKMPKELWPAIAAHWSEARSFETMAENLEQLPVSAGQLDESRGLGDLPVVVLSAGKKNPEHEADARLSSRGDCRVVEPSGHWIQLDAPDAVVNAIERVVEEVRAR